MGKYYEDTNYSDRAFKYKSKIVSDWIAKTKPKSVWDAGANNGIFSRLASQKKIFTVASDIDELAIEEAFNIQKKCKDKYLLPLIVNLTNPSPAIGWDNCERPAFIKRSSFDLAMCLAFVHHLAIANNLPFSCIVELFAKAAKNLIIEFVPKEDSNAKRLLASRKDIFVNYTKANFEKEFLKHFKIIKQIKIPESLRNLYLIKKRADNDR